MGSKVTRVKNDGSELTFSSDPEPGTTVIVAKRDGEKREPTQAAINEIAAREALGWSQAVLTARISKAVGESVDRSHLANFETGQNKGTGAQLRAYLAAGFGVTLDDVAALLDGAMTPDAFVTVVRQNEAAPKVRGAQRAIVYDDDYPNRAKVVDIVEEALADLRRVANAEGDKPLDWWLDRFTKVVRIKTDAAVRVDEVVTGGDDVFDAKPDLGPGKRGK